MPSEKRRPSTGYALKVGQNLLQDLLGREVIRCQVEIAVLTSMRQTADLLLVFSQIPVQRFPLCARFITRVEVYQHIRLRQHLPHILYEGVLLDDLARIVVVLLQSVGENGFPRSTGSNDGDVNWLFWCGIEIFTHSHS